MSEVSPRAVTLAGVIGALGALLAGLGECALHYSSTGYADAETYHFFVQLAPWRLTVGHFLSVFTVPLYFIGYWHLYERLRPAPRWARLGVLLLGLYAFALGDVWLGSRVYLAQLARALAAARSAGAADTAHVLGDLLQQALRGAGHSGAPAIAPQGSALVIGAGGILGAAVLAQRGIREAS